MNANRRDIMKTIALGGAVAASERASAAAPVRDARLVHHVLFWLKKPESTTDRDQLVAGLRTLAAIPVILGLHIGIPAATEQRDVVDASFDVSELMFFDNAEDQKIYQDHPIHQAFIARCSHLWSKVIVYDAVGA